MALLRDASPKKIRRSRHDSLIERTNLSAYAFRFGDCGGNFIAFTPTLARIHRNSVVNSGSRSWIRYRFPFRISVDHVRSFPADLSHPEPIRLRGYARDLH